MHVTRWLRRCLCLAVACAAFDAAAASAWQDLGQGVVLQTEAGLRWTKQDNGQDIDWPGAKSWCANMGEGWRLPTVEELDGLYMAADKAGQHAACGKSTCTAPPQLTLSADWHWSGTALTKAQARDADELAWGVTLVNGHRTMGLQMAAYGARALCVSGQPSQYNRTHP